MANPTVGVLAVFKNEADILGEWLRHYHFQGVDRFYLVNNGSDDRFEDVLQRFDEQHPGTVTWTTDNRRHAQVALYDTMYETAVLPDPRRPEWLLIVDLDEFVFGSAGQTLGEYLATQPPDVALITVHWIMFGSSGHHDVHPSGDVRLSFRRRAKYPLTEPAFCFRKTAVRTSALVRPPGIHMQTLNADRAWRTVHLDTATEEAMHRPRRAWQHNRRRCGCTMPRPVWWHGLAATPSCPARNTTVPFPGAVPTGQDASRRRRRGQGSLFEQSDKKTYIIGQRSLNGAMYDRFRDRAYFDKYDVNEIEDDTLAQIARSEV